MLTPAFPNKSTRHSKIRSAIIMKTTKILLFTLLGAATASHADVMRIEWSGTIDSITEFRDGALPDGVSVGMGISGITDYNPDDPYEHRDILGSHTFGDVYRFAGSVLQVVNAGEYVWRTEGAKLSFTGWSYETRESFDVFMTSDEGSVLEFPNYVGYVAMGFFAWDDTDPLLLYQSRILDAPGFDFSQFTDAGGSLTTCYFDGGGDITDGYSLWFDIASISISTIPEPSAGLLVCSGLAVLTLIRARKRE